MLLALRQQIAKTFQVSVKELIELNKNRFPGGLLLIGAILIVSSISIPSLILDTTTVSNIYCYLHFEALPPMLFPPTINIRGFGIYIIGLRRNSKLQANTLVLIPNALDEVKLPVKPEHATASDKTGERQLGVWGTLYHRPHEQQRVRL